MNQTQPSPFKLHLGCGEKYLEGYWNIDFPEGEHSVMSPKVDEYGDIRTLEYPEGSVDEIRSHHLFEHFSRAEALKLLARWRTWLKPGGVLMIETPDFTTSAAFLLNASSVRRRFQLARHMIGSQEAGWALHKDYWDKQKFRFVLSKMGFEHISIYEYHNGVARHARNFPGPIGRAFKRMPESLYRRPLNVVGNLLPESFYQKFGSNKMPNILAVSQKGPRTIDADAVAREILSLSLAGKEGDRLLNVWMKEYKNF